MQNEAPKVIKYKRRSLFKIIRNYKWLYLMLVIPLAQYILFRYAPLTGLQVASRTSACSRASEEAPGPHRFSSISERSLRAPSSGMQ